MPEAQTSSLKDPTEGEWIHVSDRPIAEHPALTARLNSDMRIWRSVTLQSRAAGRRNANQRNRVHDWGGTAAKICQVQPPPETQGCDWRGDSSGRRGYKIYSSLLSVCFRTMTSECHQSTSCFLRSAEVFVVPGRCFSGQLCHHDFKHQLHILYYGV